MYSRNLGVYKIKDDLNLTGALVEKGEMDL